MKNKINKLKRITAAVLVLIFVLSFPETGLTMGEESDGIVEELESEVNSLNQQTEDAQEKYEKLSKELAAMQEEVGLLYSQYEALNIKAQSYRNAMSSRIQWMYETGSKFDWLLSVLDESTSIMDFASRVTYYKAILEYDAMQMAEYEETLEEITTAAQELESAADALSELSAETASEKARLAVLLSSVEDDLYEAKSDAAAAEAAAEAKKESGTYRYGTSGGVLTKTNGVVYYNGHRETWYSQKVLSGGGLDIPGRYVDEDGLIRDEDGYICVASSDLEKGTLVEISLGMAKVYDSGCASGTIDVYTDW